MNMNLLIISYILEYEFEPEFFTKNRNPKKWFHFFCDNLEMIITDGSLHIYV